MLLKRIVRTGALLAAAPLALAAQPAMLRAEQPAAPSQADFDALARDMGLRYEVVDNHPEKCPEAASGCFLSTIAFTMPARLPAGLEASDFAIYFSFVNRLPLVESDIFANTLINGDFNRLTLKPGARLEPGKRYEVKLWGQGAHHSAAFPMPNLYIAAKGVQARTIEASRPVIEAETGLERLPFLVPLTNEAKLASRGGEDETVWQTPQRAFDAFAERGTAAPSKIVILPTPQVVKILPGAPIDLTGGVQTHLFGLTQPDIAPALAALEAAGVGRGTTSMEIRADATTGFAPGAYRLKVDGARTAPGVKISIMAGDAEGASNAVRSLVQQVLAGKGSVQPFAVEDTPRYGFRGLHIDLARNFHSKEELLKLVEAMAAYKLNKLHLHLADDEGWRIEIKALPELTEIGSKRCHDPSEQSCILPQLGAGPEGNGPVNGYLSQADYVEIVKAATARQIEVIPSLDMPGHSRAAIKSMEVRYNRLMAAGRKADAEAYRLAEPADTTKYRSIQNYDDNTLNVCIDQTYRFLDTAVDEIAALHKAGGAPLKTFHIGADETAGAWGESPACKPLMASTGRTPKTLGAYFIERVLNDLAKKGMKVAGWSDGMGHTDPKNMPKSVQTNIWATLYTGGITEAHVQANHGWDVVISIPDVGYLDMPYVPHGLEGGYDWASRSVDTMQVYGFMPDNLPANAALIRDTYSRPQTIEDKTPRDAGRGVTGMQAQLWSETTRTDAGVDYQLFPRMIAFAERAWRKPAWEPVYKPGQSYGWHDPAVDRTKLLTGWRDFAGRMPSQLALLDTLGVAYRITPPGARVVGGKLEANAEYPGTAIEYRLSGGAWQRYTAPVAVRGKVDLRTRSADGKRASRTVTVE